MGRAKAGSADYQTAATKPQNAIPYDSETTIIPKNQLAEKGFDFRFYTNILETKKGCYHFNYEYGWLHIEPNKILVVRTDRYDDFTFAS